MIFVTVGTNEAPFDRLVAAVDALVHEEEVVVQHGASRLRPVGAICVDFMPFEGMVEHVRRARAVVTHAGVGSVMLCLVNELQPIVVPRLKRFGEAVDDHQLSFGRHFERAGLVRLVENPANLAAALSSPAGSGLSPAAASGPLVEDLRAYLIRNVDGSEALLAATP